ncbi:tetratricopeptide repeat protein [Thermomonas sp.]|uniref:YfgM family protein n=1 Tax=Thermomonas sp. TaxID=1971895 RepID=UPI002C80D816|nr:tetratricopeptide repeat protein [Thermomonas sp.]HRO63517.1 tetratricopeptide repeat protein [Thermomonas sp.]
MAIDDLLVDEHEQSERVRNWLRNNGIGIIAGIGLGLGAIYGWQWWQGQQMQQRREVSARYSQGMDALAQGRIPADGGKALIAELDRGNPTLGTLAALQAAKALVDAGRRDEAIAALRGVKTPDPNLAPVLQERLARLLIDANKPDEALALLKDDRDPAMLAARGDAQYAKGDRAAARDAYTRALGLVDVGDPQHRLLTLKLIEAGGTPPHSEDNS